MSDADADSELVKVRVYKGDRERVNSLKRGNDNQEDVIRRLLNENMADADSDHEGEMHTDDDVREQLDRIESRAEEATTAAQNAEATASEVRSRMDR